MAMTGAAPERAPTALARVCVGANVAEVEPGAGQIQGRLTEAVGAELVGRARERAELLDWLEPGQGPAVVFVWGAGGIGKSTLVRGALASAGGRPLLLDGHDVEPTPAGLLRAVGAAIDATTPPTPDEAAAMVATADVSVLVIDAYERLNLVDGWLRNSLLVRLPSSVTTVIVGRRPPNLAWRAAPGWRRLLAELVVDPLADSDARRLVDRHPLPPERRELVLRFGRGHPLALELAAEAFARHPDLHLPEGPPAEVVEELFEVLLDDLADADRSTVEAAAVLRRVTQPLLTAVLSDDSLSGSSTERAWRLLRGLPYVTTTSSGLRLDGVAHHVIGDALEIRDPVRVGQLRRRAANAVLRDAAGGDSWDATADLLFLVQNPIIRNSYVPPGDQQHAVEQAALDDLPAILAITETYDGSAGAGLIRLWWNAHRDRFVVGRGTDGEVTAFSVVVRLSEVDHDLARTDDVLRVFLDDLRLRPLADGEDALLHRRALGARRGELPSPELGAMIVDIKRQYLELRTSLARTYIATARWSVLGPLLRSMGFAPLGPTVAVGQTGLLPCVLEFGPGYVDGWLFRHILVETSDPLPTPAAEAASTDPPARSSAEDPPSISRLSPREREVVVLLADGLSNSQIAEQLFISERTTNRHLSNIFTKLGVRNRTAAAKIAIQAGLAG